MKTMNLNVATANVMNGYVEAKKFFYKTHKRYPNNGELNTFIKNNNEKSISRVLSLSPLIFSLTALNRSKIKELEELLKDSYKRFKLLIAVKPLMNILNLSKATSLKEFFLIKKIKLSSVMQENVGFRVKN